MTNGKLFVISGASGVGKSTVLAKVMEKRKDLTFSVSDDEFKPLGIRVFKNQLPGVFINSGAFIARFFKHGVSIVPNRKYFFFVGNLYRGNMYGRM